MPQQAVQKNKPTVSSKADSSVRARIMTAKSALGLKGLNASAAAAGHQLYSKIASDNPNLQQVQVLNRISPTARKHYMQLSTVVPTELLSDKVPMNQFRATLNRLKATRNVSQLNNEYEISDNIQESVSLDESFYPPQMMVLRRTGVRIFPDGRRVALYSNDKLGLVFTVPFRSSGVTDTLPNVTAEEFDADSDDIMESLEQVAKYASEENPKAMAKHFKFADGSKMKVAHGVAKALHMVHGALNDQNKKKFADMLNNPQGFQKAADFALSKVQFTIGGK